MQVLRTRRALDPDGVDAVAQAAMKAAERDGRRVVVAVVDAWGRVQQLRRTADAQPASDRVAIDKARTAAIFLRPSREIEAQVSGGRLGALALHGAVALTGGVPLVVDGEVVGAIGTSGETPDQDEAVSLAGAAVTPSTRPVPALTRAGAQAVAEAAGAVATARGVAPVIAVVDSGGALLHLWRPDAAQVASVDVATDKARTAALFRRPSKDFEDQAAQGRPSALHLAGAVPLQGGIPLVVDGAVAGAVGVSGASSADEDLELANIAVAALADSVAAASPTPDGDARQARRVPAGELAGLFAAGGVFARGSGYAVDAGRRTAPGEVEWHARVTDVMHVVAGHATVVTGGEMVDVRDAGPGERRARATTGGTTHRLAPGDVLVVPSGVPHHFVEVSDPFTYLVVKVEG
jgi:glc operon protein GlcG